MTDHEPRNDMVSTQLAFWRAAAIALLTFLMGNGVAWVVFGIHTASKDDIAAVQESLSGRMSALEEKNDALEKTVNRLVGELSGKGVVPPTP